MQVTSLYILTINSGSSSIKFALYEMGKSERQIATGTIEGIGEKGGVFRVNTEGRLKEVPCTFPHHRSGLDAFFRWLKDTGYDNNLYAVGHRVVHGGLNYRSPHIITPQVLDDLKRLAPFVPEHLPHEIEAIEAVADLYPSLRQVACFDTAFFSDMPDIARLYALPRNLFNEGVVRYGFHGLSYEYIMQEIKRLTGEDKAKGRIIMAHLGHGASMTAVNEGRVVDTTMGFSPSGGLVMSTRSGDLDPGVILYIIKQKGAGYDELNDIVNRRGGVLGVSGISDSIKELLAIEEREPRAGEAIDLFCYQAKKFIGALSAVMGGVDILVFTGGIGENSPEIRWRICKGLEFLGVSIHPEHNKNNAPLISRDNSRVMVRVIKTNEELMIARHTCELLKTCTS